MLVTIKGRAVLLIVKLLAAIQATQSLETVEKASNTEVNGPSQEVEESDDKGAVRRSSSGGFIVNKPDPSILPSGQHIRHNYRGGPREHVQSYQRQPTLPSLPEVDDAAGSGDTEEGVATEEQQKQLTTL